MYTAREHWEHIYTTKVSNEVSWYQEDPQTSVALIVSTNLGENAHIIDVGGGDSRLADKLLDRGFKYITLLDISSGALEKSKKRLGTRAGMVKWVVSDIREFETDERYDIWHDRATLHFLTAEKDINKYVDSVRRFLKPHGYLIISTFSTKGPKKCSGLDIQQYSEDSMKKLFSDFDHIKSFEEKHVTPWEADQIFIFSMFRKR